MEQNNSDEDGVITIDLSPLYQEFNEEIAHEKYFRWTRQQDEEQTGSLTLTRVDTAGPDNRCWSNIQHPIDISGRPSVHRILLIRDITKRLRDLELFSRNSIVEIYFKLEDTEFSLGLNPTSKQPGNALLKMTGAVCGIFRNTHKQIAKFECFAGQLNGKTIDSIVTRARKGGKQIREEDIDTTIEGEENIKKIMAEQLTFFMLIYDFEIARRLQRPYVNYSHFYDELPIGIGIALNHLINKERKNRWKFCSSLFVSEPTSRKQFLEGIMAKFKKRDEHLNLNRLLKDHFGGDDSTLSFP